jgi:predicted RNA-binding Zn-ribbon protein involved in translation (DUF1610 family)
MRAVLKIIGAIVLIIVGIYWYFPSFPTILMMKNYESLVLLFQGVFGGLLLLIGLFVLWLETEELKTRTVKKEAETAEKIEDIKSALETKPLEKTSESFICPQCGKAFTSEKRLQNHLNRLHTSF